MVDAMTTTLTPRLGLPQSDAGTDNWPARVGFNDIFGDLEDLAAIDVQVANLAARPAAGVRGRYCWVEADGTLWRDTGVGWFQVFTQGALLNDLAAPDGDVAMGGFKLTDLANGTGPADAVNRAQLDAVQTAIAATKLSAFAAPDAHVAMGGFKITGLADGVAATDAATVGQLPDMNWGTGTRSVGPTTYADEIVNHGLGVVPTNVQITSRISTTNPDLFFYTVTARTTTTITVRCKNMSGSTVSMVFDWLAIV